jgi:hypothetical protein
VMAVVIMSWACDTPIDTPKMRRRRFMGQPRPSYRGFVLGRR